VALPPIAIPPVALLVPPVALPPVVRPPVLSAEVPPVAVTGVSLEVQATTGPAIRQQASATRPYLRRIDMFDLP
jgi:hypothetical protein